MLIEPRWLPSAHQLSPSHPRTGRATSVKVPVKIPVKHPLAHLKGDDRTKHAADGVNNPKLPDHHSKRNQKGKTLKG